MDAERWKRVDELLHAALELPAEQRAIFLRKECASDPGLMDEIQSLLTSDRRAGGFLESSAISAAARVVATTERSQDNESLAGQMVSNYRILKSVGVGGMGTVWLAERADGRFERQVAIKFINLAMIGQGNTERFKREGSILGRLSHPHIGELIDAGVTDRGEPYLVLEYIEGRPIDQYCDAHALSIDDRIHVFLDVLDAVSHAHVNLIVHRDIKPSNVLVRNDGQAKLLDFGIAKLLETQPDQPGLTLETAAALTPQFAAPEQLTGGPITTATDVYGLGVLLYLLLTSLHPAGREPRSSAEWLRAIVDVEPLRLPQALAAAGDESRRKIAANRSTTPVDLARELRGDLEIIVSKALKKQPNERYASVGALADDLSRYLQHQPISARPDSWGYSAAKFVRRNRAMAALGAFAFLALVVGTFGTLLQARSARAQRDFALRELARAEAINDLNKFVLSDAAPSGKALSVADLLARAEQTLERQQGGDDASRTVLMISVGQQYISLDEDDKALKLLAKAYDLARQLPDVSLRAAASCSYAVPLAVSGEHQRAERLVEEGLAMLPATPQYALDRMNCFSRGSAVSRASGRSAEGVERALATREMLKSALYTSPLLENSANSELAEAFREAGKYWEAIPVFSQASAQLTRLGRDDTETAGTLYNNWALTLSQVGRPRDAEALFRRALDISRDQRGEQAVSPFLLLNYARVLQALSRFPEAADYAERAYAQAIHGRNEVATNQALLLRVRIYRDQHNMRRAQATLAEVAPRLRRALPPGHFALIAITIEEALNASEQGEPQRAMDLLNQVFPVVENRIKSGTAASELLPYHLGLRAGMEMKLKMFPQAEEDAKRGLEILRSDTPPDKRTSRLGSSFLILARVLDAEGKKEDARRAAASALEQLTDALGPDHPYTHEASQIAN